MKGACTMGRINRLSEHLSNMIAAGEVVERPSGIVKELVENCIDAKAMRIEIQITQGGIDTISISDDGIGMDFEDAQLAFERHATSKLKEEADLWSIHTMGFRGEALPSIAAVSQVLLRTNNGVESSEVCIAYGEKKYAKPAGTPKGTSIEIRNLFQKTPARFKHLKSPQYEFSLISDIVQKFALAHPDISFYLAHDGKVVFQTKGTNQLREVMMQIYGRDVAKSAIEIDYGDYDYQINGYIAQPNYNRATKYYMTLFINQRMIRNFHLQKAILDAYREYLPKDRYPIVVLNIEMEAQLVDVNVHPSKWEIRLSKEKQLEKLMYQAIEEALKEEFQVVQAEVKKPKEKLEITELELVYSRDPSIRKLHDEVNKGFMHPETITDNPNTFFVEDEATMSMSSPFVKEKEKEKTDKNTQEWKYPQNTRPHNIKVEYNKEEPSISIEKIAISKYQEDTKTDVKQEKLEEKGVVQLIEKQIKRNVCLPEMEVIGQFHQSYILAQGEAGLYIIDQHAAQERYHFEVLREKILSGNNDVQPLIVPISIETDTVAVSQVDALNESFSALGIRLEVFGNTTFVVRELPTWVQDLDEVHFLQDLVDLFLKEGEVHEEKIRHLAISTMACHSSIRFHRTLTLEEMKQVLLDLRKCEQPFHCPHGRPTFICLSDDQLIKEFLR